MNQIKVLLTVLKKFKVQKTQVMKYEGRNDYHAFHSSARLIASDSDFEEAFKSMHQSIMTKKKLCYWGLDYLTYKCKA